jgi:hypothetical protein
MFRVSFETCNAAFGETETERRAEVARILRKVIRQVESDYANESAVVMDANGNKVGDWSTDRRCICDPPMEDRDR